MVRTGCLRPAERPGPLAPAKPRQVSRPVQNGRVPTRRGPGQSHIRVVRRRIEPMNIRVPSLVSALALVATHALAAEPSATPVQVEKHFESQVKVTAKMDYLLFLPQGYEQSKQTWPLMLFLHGAGESGTDLAKVKVHGPPKIVESKPDFPFILV